MNKLKWASRVLALAALLAGAVAGWGFLDTVYIQVAGASAGLFGIASRWCEQQLPAKGQAGSAAPD
jgi:hypothetical protein